MSFSIFPNDTQVDPRDGQEYLSTHNGQEWSITTIQQMSEWTLISCQFINYILLRDSLQDQPTNYHFLHKLVEFTHSIHHMTDWLKALNKFLRSQFVLGIYG